jgi:transposase
LSKEQAKRVRSLMHDFRRRPEDLKPEQTAALDDLFDKVPVLGQIYHLRWQATEIFDKAPNRKIAARQLREWIADARESELDWEPFIKTLENNWKGILAYFDERRSSGPVEGLNTKMRVITRRSYGLRNISTLWTRALLDVNWAAKKVGQSITAIRELVGRIRGSFTRCYT